MAWKKNLPFSATHVGAIVTSPYVEVANVIPPPLWGILFGGLVVGTVWAYSGEIRTAWSQCRKAFRKPERIYDFERGDHIGLKDEFEVTVRKPGDPTETSRSDGN